MAACETRAATPCSVAPACAALGAVPRLTKHRSGLASPKFWPSSSEDGPMFSNFGRTLPGLGQSSSRGSRHVHQRHPGRALGEVRRHPRGRVLHIRRDFGCQGEGGSRRLSGRRGSAGARQRRSFREAVWHRDGWVRSAPFWHDGSDWGPARGASNIEQRLASAEVGPIWAAAAAAGHVPSRLGTQLNRIPTGCRLWGLSVEVRPPAF